MAGISKHTKIKTLNYGILTIEEIFDLWNYVPIPNADYFPKKEILIETPNGYEVIHKIHSGRNKHKIRIKSNSATLIGSINQKIFVDSKWKKLKTIKEGNILILKKEFSIYKEEIISKEDLGKEVLFTIITPSLKFITADGIICNVKSKLKIDH